MEINLNYTNIDEALSLVSSEYNRIASVESSTISKSQSLAILLSAQAIYILGNLKLNSLFSMIVFALFCLSVFFDFTAIKNINRGEIKLGEFNELATMNQESFKLNLLDQYEALIAEMREILKKRKLYFNLTFSGICIVFLGLLLLGHI